LSFSNPSNSAVSILFFLSNLYSLLKSQWAHRFGVESLEELKKIEDQQNAEAEAAVDAYLADKGGTG